MTDLESTIANARREALEEAAKLIEDGYPRPGISSKTDKCPHDKFKWEECDECSAWAIRKLAAQSSPTPPIDSGRFETWSLTDIAGQCRMQSRDQLDPEFSLFMAEVSKRLFAFAAAQNVDVETAWLAYTSDRKPSIWGREVFEAGFRAATATEMPNSAGSQNRTSAEVRHGARADDRTLPGGAGSTSLTPQMRKDEKAAFNHGYLIACCNIVNLHDEPGVAFDVLSELGITKAEVKALDLTDYDMKALRKIERERGNVSVYRSAAKEGSEG